MNSTAEGVNSLKTTEDSETESPFHVSTAEGWDELVNWDKIYSVF